MAERIVFLDRETLPTEIRPPAFEHVWEEYPNTTPDQVRERLDGATIAMTNKVRLDRKTLEQLPSLRFIAVAATGVDNVDLDACQELGIPVSNIQDYAAVTVPEHAILLMLALRRNLLSYVDDVHRGLWQSQRSFSLLSRPISDLYDSTIGIVGCGHIGRATAELARAFGMTVLLSERRGARQVRPNRTPFEKLLEQSDVVSLHCALTEETEGLIGKAELERMKSSAILINTARGGLIDEMALMLALRDGGIAGAAVDVLSEEPPRKPNPLVGLGYRNLIITPHVAWASAEAMRVLADQLTENLEAFEAGAPIRLVSAD